MSIESKENDAIVVFPLSGVKLSKEVEIFNVKFFPTGEFKFPPNFFTVIDTSGQQDEIAEKFNTKPLVVVSYSKEDLNQHMVVISPDDDERILSLASKDAERALDLFRFYYSSYCTIAPTVPRAGDMGDGYSYSYIDCRGLTVQKYSKKLIYSQGILISYDQIVIDVDSFLKIFADLDISGEFSAYVEYALKLNREILFQDNFTSKFVQTMTLFEYLAFPNNCKIFKEVKKEISALVCENEKEYNFLLNRFYELTSKKDFGYRTQIVHNGKELIEMSSEKYFVKNLLEELQYYISKYIFVCLGVRNIFSMDDFFKYRSKEKQDKLKATGLNNLPVFDLNEMVIIDLSFFLDQLTNAEKYYKKKVKSELPKVLDEVLVQFRCPAKARKVKFIFVFDKDGSYDHYLVDEIRKTDLDNVVILERDSSVGIMFSNILKKAVDDFFHDGNSYFMENENLIKLNIIADDLMTSDYLRTVCEKRPDIKIYFLKRYHDTKVSSKVPYVNIDYLFSILLDIPRDEW